MVVACNMELLRHVACMSLHVIFYVLHATLHHAVTKLIRAIPLPTTSTFSSLALKLTFTLLFVNLLGIDVEASQHCVSFL